jgi:hypothetical protein
VRRCIRRRVGVLLSRAAFLFRGGRDEPIGGVPHPIPHRRLGGFGVAEPSKRPAPHVANRPFARAQRPTTTGPGAALCGYGSPRALGWHA